MTGGKEWLMPFSRRGYEEKYFGPCKYGVKHVSHSLFDYVSVPWFRELGRPKHCEYTIREECLGVKYQTILNHSRSVQGVDLTGANWCLNPTWNNSCLPDEYHPETSNFRRVSLWPQTGYMATVPSAVNSTFLRVLRLRLGTLYPGGKSSEA